MDELSKLLNEIAQFNNEQDLVSVETVLTETVLELAQRSIDQEIPGLRCGFHDLDAITQGFQRSDLVIIAGRPSMGKTSFALNVGSNIAQIHQLPIAIFSLEMPKEQLVYRLLSSEAQIETGRLRSGRVGEHEWSQIGAAINNLSSRRIFIDDTRNITITQMRSKCRRLQAEQGMDLGAILLDCLQLMEGGGNNRVQELSKITRSLKNLARELNVPIFALSQISHDVESRYDKRPVISDLAGSGSIEQDADLIIMLYREEYYNPDTPDRGVSEILIKKHRNGPTGVVKLLFEPEFTRFKNMANPNRY